ncbi:MAG TPA: YkgJ family cysteine cluster protein [Ignisphaera aggregans]|uniref:YkgJ family cysteine cluster protein n=1 Tax=Ignisphaera aggregans TaxID=334771 RepID=A0A832YYX7_9CREN|nr:YkgJ family cysteine cluster protein [Ignisphaera aggregans]
MVFEHTFCQYCLRCCINTEMILLRSDIERISRYGFDPTHFAEKRGRFIKLKNVDNHCVFLDPQSRRCTIYEIRPLGCRLYPLIYVEGIGVTLDSECPLSRYWMSRCDELETGLKQLEEFLMRLEIEYRYRVDWRLFNSSKASLLSMCKDHRYLSPSTP